jgi:hypothetical protein
MYLSIENQTNLLRNTNNLILIYLILITIKITICGV